MSQPYLLHNLTHRYYIKCTTLHDDEWGEGYGAYVDYIGDYMPLSLNSKSVALTLNYVTALWISEMWNEIADKTGKTFDVERVLK